MNTITTPYWIFLARILRLPVICYCHELVGGRRAARWLLYAGVRMADRTVAVSEAVKGDIIDAYPSLGERVTVVHNAAFEFPKGLPIQTGHERDVVVIGRLSPRKGQELVIEALRSLPRGTDTRLHLCGTAVKGNESYERRLRALASELSIPVWFHGFVEKERAFSLGGIVVVPSVLPDPCPLVVLEALAAGRMIIAAASGGIPEILATAGTLVRSGDVDQLAEELSSAVAMSDDSFQARLLAARTRAAELPPKIFFDQIDAVVSAMITEEPQVSLV